MLNRTLLVVVALILPALLNAAEVKQKPWNERMKKLYSSLSSLLVDISSDSRFDSPANKARIEANAKALADLAHDLSSITKDGKTAAGTPMISPDLDPSVPMITSLFAEDAKRAYEALKSGHRAYARSILRGVSGYCIGCHTRTNSGPDLKNLPEPPELKTLSRVERADFLASTRQYDKALKELETVLDDRKALKERSLEWEKAARVALAIAVRVRQDPSEAMKIVDKITSTEDAPSFLREDALAWKKSIQEWKAEMPRKAQTEDGLYAEAVRLIQAARTSQKFPADHSGDVIYLRMTAVVHDLLRIAPDGHYTADGLFLLGLSYEALRDLNLWSLHEMYYEACIRKAPHTDTSKGCFRHYEQTIYAGYSGSGGVSIPREAQRKLDELEKLSLPADGHQ